MNENFFVNFIFNILIISIISCCLNLLFSASFNLLRKRYQVLLWLITIGFYEPYFNNDTFLEKTDSNLKTNGLTINYNLPKKNFNFWTEINNGISKYSILLTNIILFGIIFMRWVTSGYFPISNLYESLMFLTWCILTILVIAGYKIGFEKIS